MQTKKIQTSLGVKFQNGANKESTTCSPVPAIKMVCFRTFPFLGLLKQYPRTSKSYWPGEAKDRSFFQLVCCADASKTALSVVYHKGRHPQKMALMGFAWIFKT